MPESQYRLYAKDFALPFHKVLGLCHDLQMFASDKGKIDLGNPRALYQYNKCLFKVLDNIEIDLDINNEKNRNLIPTAGLRRLVVDVIMKNVNPSKVIEVGTGSLAIIALLLAKMNVKVIATEIDLESVTSAKKHVQLNNLENYITIVKSEGGILDYLESYFPVDCVLSLPPYYSEDTKSDNRKRGFGGTNSELYSFGESTDFTLKLINEWYELQPILYLCILVKNKDDLEVISMKIKSLDVNLIIYEIIAGTRTRYFVIINRVPSK